MTDHQLGAVRCLVEEESHHLDFEAVELATVYKDDQYVNTFLQDNNGDVDKTAAAILRALAYRKKHQVYKIKAADLPMEFFAWNSRVGSDIYGRKVVWTNSGCYRNIAELVDMMVKVEYLHFEAIRATLERCDVYVDLSGSSLRSLNVRMTRKLSSLLTTCFPGLADHMYILGLPPALTTAVRAMVAILPGRYLDKIHFITVEEAKARIVRLKCLPRPQGANFRQVLLAQNVAEARVDQIIETFSAANQMSDSQFSQLGL
ncbi:hypothetical protein HDE_00523 [Halotydeus destructor]|nr:hypothetical protein HDE_00523 [Halotydeus destructor]